MNWRPIGVKGEAFVLDTATADVAVFLARWRNSDVHAGMWYVMEDDGPEFLDASLSEAEAKLEAVKIYRARLLKEVHELDEYVRRETP
jgi:hypothetical protein